MRGGGLLEVTSNKLVLDRFDGVASKTLQRQLRRFRLDDPFGLALN